MTPFLSGVITVTLVLYASAMGVALACLLRGPRAQDRVVALDLLFLIAMLAMLALGIRYDSNMYFEGALLMALFGFIGSAALGKFLLRGEVIE